MARPWRAHGEKGAARGWRARGWQAEIPLTLDVGRALGERRTGGGHGATCRALDVGQGRGEAATGGARARRSAPRRRATDAGSVTTARTVMRPAHPVAALDVHVEGSPQERGPIDAGKRRVERAAKESVPVRDGEDVRGHRKRRPRHEERRRWHSRSGRDERRLARPTLRARPQPRLLEARDDGGSELRSCLCPGRGALLLGRRRGASCIRFRRARHHARSPWVARREHPVQPEEGGSAAAEPSPPDAPDTLPATSRAA